MFDTDGCNWYGCAVEEQMIKRPNGRFEMRRLNISTLKLGCNHFQNCGCQQIETGKLPDGYCNRTLGVRRQCDAMRCKRGEDACV
jgi:hypothetical protein